MEKGLFILPDGYARDDVFRPMAYEESPGTSSHTLVISVGPIEILMGMIFKKRSARV